MGDYAGKEKKQQQKQHLKDANSLPVSAWNTFIRVLKAFYTETGACSCTV